MWKLSSNMIHALTIWSRARRLVSGSVQETSCRSSARTTTTGGKREWPMFQTLQRVLFHHQSFKNGKFDQTLSSPLIPSVFENNSAFLPGRCMIVGGQIVTFHPKIWCACLAPCAFLTPSTHWYLHKQLACKCLQPFMFRKSSAFFRYIAVEVNLLKWIYIHVHRKQFLSTH